MGMPTIGNVVGQLTLSVRPRRVSVSPLAASQSEKSGEYGVRLKSPATISGPSTAALRAASCRSCSLRAAARRGVVGARKCTPNTVNSPSGARTRASIAGERPSANSLRVFELVARPERDAERAVGRETSAVRERGVELREHARPRTA